MKNSERIKQLEAEISALQPEAERLWDIDEEMAKKHRETTKAWSDLFSKINCLKEELKYRRELESEVNPIVQPVEPAQV